MTHQLKKIIGTSIAAGTLLLTIASVGVSAQTNKKKPQPKPFATPLPELTAAEIISRGGEITELQAVPQPTAKPAAANSVKIAELTERIKKLESGSTSDYDDKQKRMLLNLDILTRAEQRSESLRKQHFEMIEKENTIRARIEQIEFDLRPEMIERALQLAGSLRPEDIRENRRKTLEAERRNLQSLLVEIQLTGTNLNTSLQRADLMVEKLRVKLEKDIEDAFLNEEPPR